MPSTTLPKTTCLPFRCGAGAVVMKNWLPLVLGPEFWGMRQRRDSRRKRGEKGAGKTYRHGQQPTRIVPQIKILIRKRLRPIHRRASGTIAVDKVPALDHEVLNHPMEARAFVALGSAEVVLGFTGAELAEVFCGSGDGVAEELHFDAAEGLAGEGDVEEDYGVWLLGLGGCGGHGRENE